jgi:drug/metabolite transporter (DMT)-like permease
VVFLKERFTLPMLGGALLSLIGVTWVIGIGSKDLLQSPQILLGDLICLGTSALWGGYSILARLATRNRSSLQATAHAVWVMLPLFFAAAWLEWHSAPPQLTGLVILALVYIGIFPSVIAFAAWTEGVRRAGPNQAMAFYNMLPVYGALLGVLLLGESLGWSTLVGGGLVLAGGMVTALYRT